MMNGRRMVLVLLGLSSLTMVMAEQYNAAAARRAGNRDDGYGAPQAQNQLPSYDAPGEPLSTYNDEELPSGDYEELPSEDYDLVATARVRQSGARRKGAAARVRQSGGRRKLKQERAPLDSYGAAATEAPDDNLDSYGAGAEYEEEQPTYEESASRVIQSGGRRKLKQEAASSGYAAPPENAEEALMNEYVSLSSYDDTAYDAPEAAARRVGARRQSSRRAGGKQRQEDLDEVYGAPQAVYGEDSAARRAPGEVSAAAVRDSYGAPGLAPALASARDSGYGAPVEPLGGYGAPARRRVIQSASRKLRQDAGEYVGAQEEVPNYEAEAAPQSGSDQAQYDEITAAAARRVSARRQSSRRTGGKQRDEPAGLYAAPEEDAADVYGAPAEEVEYAAPMEEYKGRQGLRNASPSGGAGPQASYKPGQGLRSSESSLDSEYGAPADYVYNENDDTDTGYDAPPVEEYDDQLAIYSGDDAARRRSGGKRDEAPPLYAAPAEVLTARRRVIQSGLRRKLKRNQKAVIEMSMSGEDLVNVAF